jgi:hypothetical protein
VEEEGWNKREIKDERETMRTQAEKQEENEE